MFRSNRVKIVFILVFFFAAIVFAQDKQSNDDKNKKLREEVLSVYKSNGEQGLLDFFEKQKDKISNKFIVDFARTGVKKRKKEWLKICEIIAEESKDEKTLADVLYNTGEYFRLISDNKKADDYLEKALPIYVKLKDLAGQGDVYLRKGIFLSYSGKYNKALEIYDRALAFFERVGELLNQGDVYKYKGDVYSYISDYSKAIEMYDQAFPFYKKAGSPKDMGNLYISKGSIYFYSGNFSKALELYNNALHFIEKAEDILGQGNVYFRKGEIYFYKGEYSKAQEMYDKALLFYEKGLNILGKAYIYKREGDIYFYSGDNANALAMYDNALNIYEKVGDLFGLGNVYRSKGDICFYSGRNSAAFEMYDKSLSFFEKANDIHGQANVYFLKGNVYSTISDNLKALEMCDKALFLYEKVGDPIGQGNVYRVKGEIYFRTGNNSNALENYSKALHFYKKTGEVIGKANIFLRKGMILSIEKKNTKAFEMYDKALVLFEKIGDLLGQGNVYQSKGDVYSFTGEQSRALEMFDKALVFFKKAGNHLGQGNVFHRKGDNYQRAGKYLSALEMYEKAFSLYSEIGEIELEAFISHKKAKILKKIGKKEESLTFFEKGIANLEKVRIQTAFSEMKKSFMEKNYNQYEETVLFMLYNKYYSKGFKYFESMRGRVFLDQMTEDLVRLDKGLKSELREKRDKLVGKISAITRQMQETGGNKEKKLHQLKEEYRRVESQFNDLLIKIRLENPLYASVNYPQPLSVRDLQDDILKKGETLLSYFISPEKAYSFIVSRENFKVTPLPINEKEINSYVERFLHSIKENNTNDMNRFGSLLYKKLIKPLEKHLKKNREIIIVPAGKLETIPFGSLIIEKEKSGQPIFLLEKYRMKYVQSASLLSILRKYYTRESTSNGFIGFGDPVYDYKNFKQGKPEQGSITRAQQNGDEIKEIHRDRYARAGGIMDRLPHSGEEIKTIARLFEKESLKSVAHLREQATEDNAKAANMKDFDYIHFSCHGLLNDDFQSLVLAQLPPEKSKEDGYLTLNEIMNCDYNAKLVVLSACQTGSGKMYKGEGVTGLTRAVMYAGTPAVLSSLWKVDDTATKELMIRFYRNMLEKNMDKVEALRQAKLELLKKEKYASPLFWSAFVLYGE